MNKKNTPEKAEACYSTSFTFVYVRMNFNMAICIFTTLNKFFFFTQKSPVSCEKKNWKRRGWVGGSTPPPCKFVAFSFSNLFLFVPFFFTVQLLLFRFHFAVRIIGIAYSGATHRTFSRKAKWEKGVVEFCRF